MVSSSSSKPNEICANLIRGVLMHVLRPFGVSNTAVMTTPAISSVPDQETPRTSILLISSCAKARAVNILDAGNFIATIQNRQGFYVSCIEEIAWRNGWISTEQLAALGKEMKTAYGRYLERLAANG